MHLVKRCGSAAICVSLLMLASPLSAQTVLFNSNGFEGYSLDPLHVQDNWLTTDLNQGSTPAGVIQNTTVFSGTRALQVIGPNLANDLNFSYSTFWWQDRTANPFNPVTNGTAIVRATFRLRVDGETLHPLNMPVAGIYFEGLSTGGQQQVITSILYTNEDRVVGMTTGGSFANSVVLANSRDQWLDFQVDLNFTTQRFSVRVNGQSLLNNVNFRNTNGPTDRLVEMGFQASAIDLISPPPINNAFYDDYVVTAIAAVPEPATYALGGLAVATAVGAWRYRRRQVLRASQMDLPDTAE